MRLTKGNAGMPPLTDLDFFLLGAVTKLFATSVTYPCEAFLFSRRALPRAHNSGDGAVLTCIPRQT